MSHMTFMGRKLIVTSLDPVPPLFRIGPATVVVSEAERDVLHEAHARSQHLPLHDELAAAIEKYERDMLRSKLQIGDI